MCHVVRQRVLHTSVIEEPNKPQQEPSEYALYSGSGGGKLVGSSSIWGRNPLVTTVLRQNPFWQERLLLGQSVSQISRVVRWQTRRHSLR